MGINDRAQARKEDKSRKAEEKRKLRKFGSSASDGADWTGVDGTLLGKAVGAIARDGGALRLGYTRDGGAYAIGVYGDGEPYTLYISPNDDIEEVLRGIIEDFGS